jgi:tRNA threonylcarbamoyladenosine dehydratase
MNVEDWMSRTRLLLGNERLEKLLRSHVLVAGLGGVGAYAAEQLCRAGIGKLTIADSDMITASNKNRQLPALVSTLGKLKADVMAQRLLDINPALELRVVNTYLKNEKIDLLLSEKFDYVVDAIDTLAPKVFFILECLKQQLPLVSSMGAGGKLDPAQIRISDISESHSCRLAFYIRKRLQKFGIRSGFQVVFSPEAVESERKIRVENEANKKTNVGTISYMPAIFGCFCASVVIRDLLEKTN